MKLYIVSPALVLLTSTTPLVSAALRGSGSTAAEVEAASKVNDETAQLYYNGGYRDYNKRADGTPYYERPDGTPYYERPDGLEAVAVPETAQLYYNGGYRDYTKRADGTPYYERPDGTPYYERPDGTPYYERPDGLEAVAVPSAATLDVAEFAAVAYDNGRHHRRHSRNRRYGPESYKGGYDNDYDYGYSGGQRQRGGSSNGGSQSCSAITDHRACDNAGCSWSGGGSGGCGPNY